MTSSLEQQQAMMTSLQQQRLMTSLWALMMVVGAVMEAVIGVHIRSGQDESQ